MTRSRTLPCLFAVLLAACAGAPRREPNPAPKAEPSVQLARPAGLELPPEPAPGDSAAALLTALDRRTARMEKLYGFTGPERSDAESAWLRRALRAEADDVHRILRSVAALEPRPGAKRPEDVCKARRPRVFPKYGYQGPADASKLPYLKEAEDLALAAVGDAMVDYLCDHTPRNKKLVAAKQAEFESIRLECERLSKAAAR